MSADAIALAGPPLHTPSHHSCTVYRHYCPHSDNVRALVAVNAAVRRVYRTFFFTVSYTAYEIEMAGMALHMFGASPRYLAKAKTRPSRQRVKFSVQRQPKQTHLLPLSPGPPSQMWW